MRLRSGVLVVVGACLVAAVPAASTAQDLGRAYVATRGVSSLAVVDLLASPVSGIDRIVTVPLPAPPHDVVVAAGRVFVSLPSIDRVAEIDAVRLTVVGGFDVAGAPRDLESQLTPSGRVLFVSTADGLRAYDIFQQTLSPPIAVGPGTDRALHAPGPATLATPVLLVAACDGGAALRVYTIGGTVSAPIATGNGPCAVFSSGNAIYVANTDDDTVTVFDPALQVVTTVAVADRPVAFAETQDGIWVGSANGVLTLLDRSTHGVLNTRTIGTSLAALAATFDPAPSRDGLAAAIPSNGVSYVDLGPISTVTLFPVAGQPSAIAVGPRLPPELVTLSSTGQPADRPSASPAVNVDGRYVAFEAEAANLVPGDTNGATDIFVRDRLTQTTIRVSLSSEGAQANGASGSTAGFQTLWLSRDGRYVLFASRATNLVPGDTNGREDLFIRDRDADADFIFDEPGQVTTRRVTVQSDGTEGTCRVPPVVLPTPQGACEAPHIDARLSDDGQQVVFTTVLEFDATDLNGYADVYVHDVALARTTRIGLRPGGAPAAGRAATPLISDDGRVIAFESTDSQLVTGDTNGVADVFVIDRDDDRDGVFDEAPAPAIRVSLRADGTQYTSPSRPLALAPHQFGTTVAYAPTPSTLAIANSRHDVWSQTHTATGLLPLVAGAFGPLEDSSCCGYFWRLTVTTFTVGLDMTPVEVPLDAEGVPTPAPLRVGPPFRLSQVASVVAGGLTATLVVVRVADPTFGLGVLDLRGNVPVPYDQDGDGLADDFEFRFGLENFGATAGTGDNGANGDPDNDGRTNAQEQRDGTHPRGFFTRYLAEGATSSFFSTRIAVANTQAVPVPARVLVRYQTDTGHAASTYLSIPGHARTAVNVGQNSSLAWASFATVVESDAPVVAERSMFWGAGSYGSHAETSVSGPSLTWFLAEGATHGGFDLFYLLQNPSPTSAAQIEIRFLRTSGAPVVRGYTVPAGRRLTVWVDAIAGLEAVDVSGAVTSLNGVPVIVERAMYYTRDGVPFTAGHASAGVTATATEWFLAEGATGTFFNTFLLMANPSSSPAQIAVTYFRPAGAPIVRSRTVPANSRVTINVALEDPALADTPFSTRVAVTNGVGIVVERSMWWPAVGGWNEAHNSPGATAPATRWGFADGESGGPPFNTQTYFLVANPTSGAATVEVTLLLNSGLTVEQRTFTVPANSRFNVPVASEFPDVRGGFGAIFQSLGATPVPIVVERAMYSDAGGVVWAAGTNVLGTPLP